LKIANESKNHASPFARSFLPVNPPPSFVVSARTTKIPSERQNPPYDENAVAPNAFLLRNSHCPARS
jgi:hypothetical protein